MRPDCKVCGKPAMNNGYDRAGKRDWKTICIVCRDVMKRHKELNFYIKTHSCEKCGFIALNSCQLDIDHIDGNSKNNSVENLQTLCANCHRLKTYLNQDWV